jgi:hypothetical protein
MRFSEIPKFLLYDFFDSSTSIASPSGDSPFISGINTTRNVYFELVIEDSITLDTIHVPFYTYDPVKIDNFFYVQRAVDLETAATSAAVIENEANVYLKKSSIYTESRVDDSGRIVMANLFDKMMRLLSSNYPETSYLDYVNIEKPFLYIGKIYNENDGNDVYRIDYWGMDRYVISCLPPHMQTPKMQVFLELFFDKVYNRVYNKEKNVITLLDALEIDLKFLPYLSEMFGIFLEKSYIDSLYSDLFSDINIQMERRLRENIREMPNFLKRKGTYSSIYGLFHNLFWNTTNSLNIYERWHSKDLCNGWPEDPNAVPLSPKNNFVDFNYLNQYTNSTSATCVSGYGEFVNAGGYPVSQSDCFIFRTFQAKNVWFIVHELNTSCPIVHCYDECLNLLTPNKIFSISDNVTVIRFDSDKSGTAMIVKPQALDFITILNNIHYFEHDLSGADIPIIAGNESINYTFNSFTFPVTATTDFDRVEPYDKGIIAITVEI